jgi:hypothetical protein
MSCWYIQRGQQPRVRSKPRGSVTAETPILDTFVELTAASIEHNSLAPREFMLVRMGAPIAVDAPAASYHANADAAADSGVTAGDIQAVVIAVARLRARRGWSRQAGTSSGHWAWRSLWPTPRWPAPTPGSSINPAHHPHGGASARDNRDREKEVIAVKMGAGQEAFLLAMHVRPADLPEEG